MITRRSTLPFNQIILIYKLVTHILVLPEDKILISYSLLFILLVPYVIRMFAY